MNTKKNRFGIEKLQSSEKTKKEYHQINILLFLSWLKTVVFTMECRH